MPLQTILHLSFMDISLVMIIFGIIIARKKTGPAWLRKHIIINTVGALSAMTALIIMFLYKTSMDYPHFASLHSIVGLTTIIFLLTTLIIGNRLVTGKRNLRNTHRYLGRATAIIMIITAVTGVLSLLQIMQVI